MLVDILDPSIQGFLWVLAIGLTIVVADVFFETEILSNAAILGVSIYLSLLFDVELKWRILVALLAWVAVTFLFYFGWKKVVSPMIRRGVVRGIDESVNSAVGAHADYRLIDGKPFVYWNGDLWPLAESFDPTTDGSALNDKDRVEIVSMENGIASIRTISSEKNNTESN